MIHVDIKKIAGMSNGGGWRIHGKGNDCHHGHAAVGYRFVHTAIDDRTRIAYSELHTDEQAVTAAEFWLRAVAFFDDIGIRCERVITDNGSYRSRRWHHPCAATGTTVERRGLADCRPTAKSSVSIASCSTNGPTSVPGTQTSSAHRLRRLHPLLQSPPIPRHARRALTHRATPNPLHGDNLPPSTTTSDPECCATGASSRRFGAVSLPSREAHRSDSHDSSECGAECREEWPRVEKAPTQPKSDAEGDAPRDPADQNIDDPSHERNPLSLDSGHCRKPRSIRGGSATMTQNGLPKPVSPCKPEALMEHLRTHDTALDWFRPRSRSRVQRRSSGLTRANWRVGLLALIR